VAIAVVVSLGLAALILTVGSPLVAAGWRPMRVTGAWRCGPM
jgi:hypothetical protein